MLATLTRSGGPTALPFGLLEADEDGRWRAASMTDCVEFCLALAIVFRLPFVGTGEARPKVFESAKVLCIGEEAREGDIAFEWIVAVLVMNRQRLNMSCE
jgi:hypothetical protein